MQRWIVCGVIALSSGGAAACGGEAEAPRAAVTPGAPQGPAPHGGLRGGDLPRGATLTGAPASALARVGDTVYAAGVEWVAPLRGSALALRPGTGELANVFGTNGRISDAVADGRGGVYLAGDFDRVGPRRRRALVHVFPTGEVDRRFRPRLPGAVAALALDGGILYAGGSPDGLRGPEVRGVVAVNAGTGAPLPGFATDVAPGVTELAVRDGTLYAGGSSPGLRRLEEREETTEAPLAALDGRSGERRAGFAPASSPAGRSSVTALRVVAGRLWVGRSAPGGSRAALSLLDPSSGATVRDAAARGTVHELLRDGDRVLALGRLRGRGGRDLAQALDPATGARRGSFRVRAPGEGDATVARDGVVRGGALWLGGSGRSQSSGPGGFVGAYDARTGAGSEAVEAPEPDGPVHALASVGRRIVAAGDFAAVDVRRQDLAAFSATTGRYAAGVRLPATRAASALAAAGGRLWIADGSRLLVVDPASGGVVKRVQLPAGGARGGVRLAAAGGRVFVSGAWPGAQGVRAYDATTGSRVRFALPVATGRQPPALLGDGDVLWVGGAFAGDPREVDPGTRSVLRLDARTGRLDPAFAARLDGPVRGLLRAGDRLYVSGDFTRVGELRRRNLAAIEPETGAAVAGFEPGAAPGGGGVRLERVGEALLLTGEIAAPRAYDPEGGPAPRAVTGTSRVSATAPGAGGGRLVAGVLRRASTLGTGRRHGVVLPPRG